VVSVTAFDDDGYPREDTTIRRILDDGLAERKLPSVDTVSNTIIRHRLAERARTRDELYQRYLAMLPRLKKVPQNRHGIYFERLIRFYDRPDLDPDDQLRNNQVEHAIQTLLRGGRRASALQLSIFDPSRDLTFSARRGFPCLQHIVFDPCGGSGLSLTAFYATQDVLTRAYGNFLGLCRLGRYVALEAGIPFQRMTCVAAAARLGDVSKKSVAPLLSAFDAVHGQGG
jgi:thymidylate synthase